MRLRSFLLAICSVGLASGAAIQTTYALNLGGGTLNGNNVTNIAIFETDGSQVFVDFGLSTGQSGWQSISHLSAFHATESLIVGLDLNTPLPGSGKNHVVFFTNEAFAQGATGRLFSAVFANSRHNDFITRLLAAEGGDAAQVAWMQSFFLTGDGAAARFATAGGSTAIEFTAAVPLVIPEPSSAALALAGLMACGARLLSRRRQ